MTGTLALRLRAFTLRLVRRPSVEARRESLRLLDWAMGPFQENVTKRIVYERASQRYTGAASRRAPDMDTVRTGREALRAALTTLGASAERNGYLTTLRDRNTSTPTVTAWDTAVSLILAAGLVSLALNLWTYEDVIRLI